MPRRLAAVDDGTTAADLRLEDPRRSASRRRRDRALSLAFFDLFVRVHSPSSSSLASSAGVDAPAADLGFFLQSILRHKYYSFNNTTDVYSPADATANCCPKPHNLLPHLNPDWF